MINSNYYIAVNDGSIEQSLKDLGSCNKEIYDTLKSKRVYGKQRNACLCPIANYLKELTGTVVLVGDISASVGGIEIDLPKNIRDFIKSFDTDEIGTYQEIRI